MTHESKTPAPGGDRDGLEQTAQTTTKAPDNANTNGPLVEAAAAYARLGYVPIPLNRDRRPILCGWPDAEAGMDAAKTRFSACSAQGMALVTRGLMVVDLDRGHVEGVDGVASFTPLVDNAGGDFPHNAPSVQSPRGGIHHYMAAPVGVTLRSSASRIAPGVDIKAGRSLATCPPTSGYRWIVPLAPLVALPLVPAWLLALVCPPPSPPIVNFEPIHGGVRYAEVVFERELMALAAAPEGQRNASLFKAAARLGELVGAGMLGADMAAQGLLVAAEACGLVRDDGRRAVEATIASGLRAGMASQSPRLGGRRHGW